MPVRFVVLTGGPGAGKTAVMEAAKQIFAQDVMILPEAASIVYSGGFPRHATAHCRARRPAGDRGRAG